MIDAYLGNRNPVRRPPHERYPLHARRPRGEQRARAFDDGAAPGERADGGTGPIAKGGAPLLDLRGIRTGYGRIEALHGLDVAIHPGETVAWWAPTAPANPLC